MYIIPFILLILSVILLSFGAGGLSLLYFVDSLSIVILIVICIPVLAASGLLKDFLKAFQITSFNKKETSLVQLKRSVEGVSLAIKTNIYAGAFFTIVGFIQVMHLLTSPSEIGPNLSVAILTLLYAISANIILLSIKYRLKLMIIEYTEE